MFSAVQVALESRQFSLSLTREPNMDCEICVSNSFHICRFILANTSIDVCSNMVEDSFLWQKQGLVSTMSTKHEPSLILRTEGARRGGGQRPSLPDSITANKTTVVHCRGMVDTC